MGHHDKIRTLRRDDVEEIGKFQRTHALKGELNAELYSDDDFLEGGIALILEADGCLVPFFCESVRPKGHFTWLIKLEGIDTETEARKFVNAPIFALKADLREYLEQRDDEDDDLLLASDLEGYAIDDLTAGNVGSVVEVDMSTVNHLFVVEGPRGRILIPVADEFILDIDDAARIIHTNLPEGLIELNESTKQTNA